MKRGWLCEGCDRFNTQEPWPCPGCGKDTCDLCFDSFGHCNPCSFSKTEAELIEAANKAGFDFDEPDTSNP